MPSTKYESVKDVLIPALREGMPVNQACGLCEISRTIYYEWLKKGEAGEDGFIDIVNTIKKARAEFVQERLKNIKKHANSQWQADAWLLERTYPDDFAKLDKLAMTDPSGKTEARIIYLPEEDEEETNGKVD